MNNAALMQQATVANQALPTNDAPKAQHTNTGTQYVDLRSGLFDSGNQQPIVPALGVAKWMANEASKHFDDVALFFANDLSPMAGRQMVFQTWNRDLAPGEPEPCIVGYDAIVPPELDQDLYLPIHVLDSEFRADLYDGFDASIIAGSYWSNDECDIEVLQQARWNITLVTANDPDFWEFFANGGIPSRKVAPYFSKSYFARRLYNWARSDKISASMWLDQCSPLPKLDKATKRRATQICNKVRSICDGVEASRK